MNNLMYVYYKYRYTNNQSSWHTVSTSRIQQVQCTSLHEKKTSKVRTSQRTRTHTQTHTRADHDRKKRTFRSTVYTN